MTFINENLAYKKFEFRSCMKIKGSKFEEDLLNFYSLDITIESDEIDPEAPPTTMIDYAITLVGLDMLTKPYSRCRGSILTLNLLNT